MTATEKCRARPPHDQRECESLAGHDGPHRITGLTTDKFGEHHWTLTWRETA